MWLLQVFVVALLGSGQTEESTEEVEEVPSERLQDSDNSDPREFGEDEGESLDDINE